MNSVYAVIAGLVIAALTMFIPMENYHLISIGLWASGGCLLTGLALFVLESGQMATQTNYLETNLDLSLLNRLPKE